MKNSIQKFLPILLIFTLLFNSCKNKTHSPDISNININLKIDRFEQDVFKLDFDHLNDSNITELKKKYSEFLYIFSHKIVKIGNPDNPAYSYNLKAFITDYTMNEVYKEINKQYKNIEDIENTLSDGFKRFHYYFPNYNIPHIYTFMSGFNQSIVTTDTILGIGLDKYLGAKNDFYNRLGLSHYQRYNMHRNKIPSDCFNAWAFTQFEKDDSTNTLIDNMLYNGKIIYFTKALLPEESDSLIIGFSKYQMEWCKANEEKMWTYLVENKKLFSTDLLTISKFVNPAPFTKDFTNQSPGRAAVWIGYQIINRYMAKNSEVTLQQLMLDKNYKEILRKSKYRP